MTIPVSSIVNVNPGVVGAGGNPLSLNGVILTKSTLLVTHTPQSFESADSVRAFFGPASEEYALAQVYFLGYDNSTIKPGTLIFAPYAETARPAWLRSGSLAGMTLAQLKAIPAGTLTITVDGVEAVSASINLGAATSFIDAASIIGAAFTPALPCTWNPVNSTFTISSGTTGYTSTITFATGTIADALKFTSSTGAVISQGDDADTPTEAMDYVKAYTQNWVSFTTMWEPTIADKEAFAAWANAQNQRYVYVCWDTDAQAAVQGSTTCFGAIAKSMAYEGVICVYDTVQLATFVLGAIASIDFTRTNGRITAAFKSQSGFEPTVTDAQIAANLLENGYSFYGSYATANSDFNFLYDGNMPGKFKWLDSFVNQVFLNSQLQLSLISLLTNINSVPYNEAGYSLIRAALTGPVNSALNAGVIRVGVTLSPSQKAQINQAAGRDVTAILEQQGYYLQVLDPGAQARGLRQSPICNLWYTDGGAVQKISLASINIL